jgi:hypothetical protein
MILPNNKNLELGNKVLFRDIYGQKELEVGEVVWKNNRQCSVIFLKGFSSENRDLSSTDILGIVDETKTTPKINLKGWIGHFILFQDVNE